MPEPVDKKSTDNYAEDGSQVPANKDRREALKKMGKYAAYTAPAVIAILWCEKSYAQPAPG